MNTTLWQISKLHTSPLCRCKPMTDVIKLSASAKAKTTFPEFLPVRIHTHSSLSTLHILQNGNSFTLK